eukprot:s83_g1.t1
MSVLEHQLCMQTDHEQLVIYRIPIIVPPPPRKGDRQPHHGGGKGGKGYGKGKDFSSDQVPEERRAKLCQQLQTFVEGEDRQLEMPPSTTGLERKFLHEQAELHGLTTQSFGQGHPIADFSVDFGQEKESEGTAVEPGYVSEIAQANYTGVFLDQRSREALLNFCTTSVPGGIPHRWTRFCDHMTICVGALSNPKTEDFRSVADTVQKQIAKYREHQEFELKVVSVGRDDHVLAVGVIGCTSCNRNPHITVATAPGHPPNISNSIKKWTMIAAEEQLTLTGVVKQHGARKKAGDWDGRRFRLRCHSEHDNHLTPEEMDPRERNPIRVGFTSDEAVRLTFHQVGKTAGGETLNPGTLRGGVVMDAEAQMPVYALEGPDGQWVREVDEGPGPYYYLSGDFYDRTHFAFLPLEAGTHRPRPSGKLEGEDQFYGIYYVESSPRLQDTFTYWMSGDYPVYIVGKHLARASDECYPPLQVHVAFDDCQNKVVNVEFTHKEEEIVASCRGMSGDTLAEVRLERSETLRGLHKQLRKQLPDMPKDVSLTLIDSMTGQLLSPPPAPPDPDRKLLDIL